MVRANSWWSVVRDETSTKGSGTHLGDKIRLLLQGSESSQDVIEDMCGLLRNRIGYASYWNGDVAREIESSSEMGKLWRWLKKMNVMEYVKAEW